MVWSKRAWVVGDNNKTHIPAHKNNMAVVYASFLHGFNRLSRTNTHSQYVYLKLRYYKIEVRMASIYKQSHGHISALLPKANSKCTICALFQIFKWTFLSVCSDIPKSANWQHAISIFIDIKVVINTVYKIS